LVAQSKEVGIPGSEISGWFDGLDAIDKRQIKGKGTEGAGEHILSHKDQV
jgi:hypothetical protein